MFRIRMITGHENYAVTDDGRVFNIVTGNQLEQHATKKGYMMVKLDNEKGMSVHRLVTLMFIPNKFPDLYDQVNHKDGVKSNNNFSNLEWTNNSGNQLHAYRLGLQARPSGEEKTNSKITNEQAHEICRILQENPSYGGRRIQRIMGLEGIDSIITRIKKRDNWKDIGQLYSW